MKSAAVWDFSLPQVKAQFSISLNSWHSRILTCIIGHVLKKELRVYSHFCVMYTYVIAHAGLILWMRCPCSVVGVKTKQRDCAAEASLLAQLNSGARLHGLLSFSRQPFSFPQPPSALLPQLRCVNPSISPSAPAVCPLLFQLLRFLPTRV